MTFVMKNMVNKCRTYQSLILILIYDYDINIYLVFWEKNFDHVRKF